MKYAGFWIRVVAFLIDGIILFFLDVIVQFLLLGFGTIQVGAFYVIYLITIILQIIIPFAYLASFGVAYGQTPGKMLLRIRIVQGDGLPNRWGTLLLREIPGRAVSSIIIGLGYFWVAFDSKKQGWHDKIAGTHVIRIVN